MFPRKYDFSSILAPQPIFFFLQKLRAGKFYMTQKKIGIKFPGADSKCPKICKDNDELISANKTSHAAPCTPFCQADYNADTALFACDGACCNQQNKLHLRWASSHPISHKYSLVCHICQWIRIYVCNSCEIYRVPTIAIRRSFQIKAFVERNSRALARVGIFSIFSVYNPPRC